MHPTTHKAAGDERVVVKELQLSKVRGGQGGQGGSTHTVQVLLLLGARVVRSLVLQEGVGGLQWAVGLLLLSRPTRGFLERQASTSKG